MTSQALITQISSLSTAATSLPTHKAVVTIDEIKAVSETEIKNLIDEVVNKWVLDGFDWTVAKELFEYEGFEPRQVYKHLIACCIKHGMSGADLRQDLGLLLTLQHLKGNISSSNFKSLKPEAQDMVNKLYTRYGLMLKIGASKKTSITLPRIAAAFPLQTAIIANNIVKDFAGPFDSVALPNFMKSTSFPCLIPISAKVSRLIVVAYNAYATDQSIAITKTNYIGLSADDKMARFRTQLKYTDIAFNSTVMTSEGRKLAMYVLNIKDFYDDIKSVFDKVGIEASIAVTKTEWDEELAKWAPKVIPAVGVLTPGQVILPATPIASTSKLAPGKKPVTVGLTF